MNVGRCNNLEESALNEKYASTLPANSVTPSERYDSDVNSQMPEQFRRRQVLGPPHHGDLLAREGPGNLKTHIRVNLHLLRRRLRKATQRPAHLGQWQWLLLVWHGIRAGKDRVDHAVRRRRERAERRHPHRPVVRPAQERRVDRDVRGPRHAQLGLPVQVRRAPERGGPCPREVGGPRLRAGFGEECLELRWGESAVL